MTSHVMREPWLLGAITQLAAGHVRVISMPPPPAMRKDIPVVVISCSRPSKGGFAFRTPRTEALPLSTPGRVLVLALSRTRRSTSDAGAGAGVGVDVSLGVRVAVNVGGAVPVGEGV